MPKKKTNKIERFTGQACPWLTEGHTDNTTSEEANEESNQNRCNVKVEWNEIPACCSEKKHSNAS
jgi:hypothetical protein